MDMISEAVHHDARREIFYKIDFGWLIFILAGLAVCVLIYAVWQRYKLWRIGKPENRQDNYFKRLWDFIKTGISDGAMHLNILRYPMAGAPHFLVFWGCAGLLGVTALDTVSHYIIFINHGMVYKIVELVGDLSGVAVLIGILGLIGRRYIIKPKQLDNKFDDIVALGLVFVVVCTGFLIEGLRLGYTRYGVEELQSSNPWIHWTPVGWGLANIFGQGSGVLTAYRIMWWVHSVLVVSAIVYVSLYFTKLTHILVAPANIFLKSSRPKGALVPIDLEASETFGIGKIQDYTWKQLLDLDACTRCGRCQDSCPAAITGKPLSPKKVIQDLKQHLNEVGPSLLAGKEVTPKALAGEVITEDELWSCTTCRHCQEICPVGIEHIDKIIGLRRYLVLDQAKVPETAESLLRCIETRGHSCRGTQATRTDWTKGLDIKTLSEDKEVEYLYFVGCTAALEERNMKVAIAVANILKTAGIKFGILGTEEVCCGEPVRRLGNEYLFQMQARRNIEIFNGYGVKKVLTACPHCFNTLKNEYPQFEGKFEVIHHSQLIADLINSGKLKLAGTANQVITYHDSCYLGRHNDIYEAPRQIVGSLPGAKIVELPRHRERGFCCGGGGGRFWMEERIGKRISQERAEEVLASKAGVVATACPYCLQMFEDAIKALEAQEKLKAVDLAELVAQSLGTSKK